MQDIRDELGDLLFQVVFYTQLANEQDEFDFDAVAQGVADKLIRRHPHVFAEVNFDSVAAIKDNWEAVKQAERFEKGIAQDASILANITTGLPPLVRANKLQKRCAKVGFDWPDVTQVADKIHEELDEVMAEVQASTLNQDAIEDEVGDLLFAVVNMARHLKVDPESALRRANRKFEQRFRRVEQRLADQKLSLSDANLMQMEDAWQWVKNQTE
ncbi:nucleoside triphosphate pyrophosphohydrolase [Pseudobowmanella zhangzhouensis]